ncbi:MAG: acyl-CoA dehydratase activase [Candidatus Alcyoniella australis]|nr:acyl-CoA dehydratase activase [Candidatus Alcyoniella australis]
MLFAGIDVGSLTAEAVVVNSTGIVAGQSMSVLPNPVDSAREVLGRLLRQQGIALKQIEYTISTGYGREQVQLEGMAQSNVSEISCHGMGAYAQLPRVRTVIDIGGQDAKVIKLDEAGELADFVMNDKCAAGTGHFLEIMSRALGVTLEQLGPLSLGSRTPIEMSNRCSIYVETEVIHYLQRGASKVDLAAGINRSMAERVVALVRRVKPKREVMLTGGVAKNVAVRAELERMLQVKMVRPQIDPQLIGAYGAAVLASRIGDAQ